MFERFTDRARRVVVEAQHEARALGHDYIGTEHLLLGLISEGGGVGAKALESLGVGAEALRAAVAAIVGPGSSRRRRTYRSRRRRSRCCGSRWRRRCASAITTSAPSTCCSASSRRSNGVAGQVLADAGADLERARAEVVRLLAEYQRRTRPDGDGSQGPEADGGR